MSNCNPKDKSIIDKPDLSSISSILNIISGAFKFLQIPAQPIPPPLLLVGKNSRPGMSARNLAARMIARYESEAGESMGNVFADGDNKAAIKVLIMAQEIVSMIQTEAKVDVLIDPGAINVTVTGSAGPVPVVGQGANILYAVGGGGVT